MKTVVHVNQFAIRANDKLDLKGPVLAVKTYKANRKGNTAIVRDKDGVEIGRFVYRPRRPLSCGAKVWFETKHEVEVR